MVSDTSSGQTHRWVSEPPSTLTSTFRFSKFRSYEERSFHSKHWGHLSWNIWRARIWMSWPHEQEKVGHLGLSVSPSDFLVKGRFSYNDLLDFQQIFLSQKEAEKGEGKKNQDREGRPGVCGEKHVSLPESAKWWKIPSCRCVNHIQANEAISDILFCLQTFTLHLKWAENFYHLRQSACSKRELHLGLQFQQHRKWRRIFQVSGWNNEAWQSQKCGAALFKKLQFRLKTQKTYCAGFRRLLKHPPQAVEGDVEPLDPLLGLQILPACWIVVWRLYLRATRTQRNGARGCQHGSGHLLCTSWLSFHCYSVTKSVLWPPLFPSALVPGGEVYCERRSREEVMRGRCFDWEVLWAVHRKRRRKSKCSQKAFFTPPLPWTAMNHIHRRNQVVNVFKHLQTSVWLLFTLQADK